MPTAEHVILRELLAREPQWVSGSTLAAKLGVSRVAVWQHMEKLRAAGFEFEAQRSRGYRIAARPPTIYAPTWFAAVPPRQPSFRRANAKSAQRSARRCASADCYSSASMSSTTI